MQGESLTEEQIANFKEAFTLFDKDGDGVIKIIDLGLLVRSLNQNPTEAEILEMQNDVDPDGTGKLDFPEFISLMARKIKDVDPEEELMEAFRIFDKTNTGLISATELRHIVKQLGQKTKRLNLIVNLQILLIKGEPLSEEEAEQLIKEVESDVNGSIKYSELVRIITTSYIN